MKIYLRSILFIISLLASQSFIAQKLYWVGGSGSFNDPKHWSYESNGTGGAKTPTANDDVYFDENSFRDKSVINIIGNATCHDLIFSDHTHPVILSGTQNEKLTINGNAKFNSYITNNFTGTVYFTSSLANTSIMFGFIDFKGNVYFDGDTHWSFQSNLTVDKGASVYLNKGSFDLSRMGISVGNFIASPQVILTTQNTFFDIKNKIVLPEGLRLNDGKSNIFADYKNPAKYQVSPSIKFNSASRIGGNQSVSTTTCIPAPTVVLPTCPGSCNATITFTIPAGCSVNGPICASWSKVGGCISYPSDSCGILAGTTYSVANLCGCGASYFVFFTDTNGTLIQSSQSSITDPAQSFVTGSSGKIKPSCYGDCNGTIVVGLVGNIPLTLQWILSTTITHTNVTASSDTLKTACAGTYSIMITDASGCVSGPFTSTLGQPTPLLANGTVRAPLCFGVCNGVAQVAPSGGTSPYTVKWDGNAAATTFTLSGLCAASTHTCVVKDKNGCTVNYIVTVPAAPVAMSSTQTNTIAINCKNQCNGSLSVNNVSGGTTPYTFTWTPVGGTVVSGATNSSNSNLCPGTYTCTVTDKNGCTLSPSFTITSPPAITHTVTPGSPKCFGQPNGSIKDSISGGTPPYTSPFAWTTAGTVTGTASSSTNSNIMAGTYTVIATDSKGCKDTAITTLADPLVLSASTTTANPSCFGSTNGSICITATGGTGVDTYTWNPSANTQCISGLSGGVYSYTVSDANNCKTSASVTLVTPPLLNISVSKTNPKCFGLCNGTASVTASGGPGSPPVYTYNWTGPAGSLPSTSSQSGLCAGNYTVVVTDGTCTQTKIIALINPNPLSVSVSATPLVCVNQCNAQITSNITGGTPTYTYSWWGNGGNPVSPTAPNQSNMCAGSYSVVVTDSNNCTANASVTVAAPNAMVVTATGTNPNCSAGCNGSIVATISGGAAPLTFGWNPSIIPNSLTPNNLCAGSYTLSVIDNNGCTATQTVSLISPSTVVSSATLTNVSCAGQCDGAATALPSGGTSPYVYSWDGAANTTSVTVTGLCAGKHSLQVQDNNGCTGAVLIFTITEPTALTASISNVTKSCLNICNGKGTASASGGTTPYTYNWTDSIAGTYVSTTSVNNLCIGTHTLYVKDAHGCIASTIYKVQVIINVSILANALSVSCHNVCDGSASATPVGGTAPYTYTWTNSGGVVSNNQNATNLCPGTYTVLVEDITTCASQDTITILNPTVLTATVATIGTTCFGLCNGSATITPAGGTPPYTEQWSNNGIIGTQPTGLCAGTYTATVKDNRGCTTVKPITVNTPAQIVLTPTISSPTACVSSTGSISLGITGGTGTPTLTWSNPPGGNANPLTGLAAGIYTASVTDANGCSISQAIGVSDPTGPATNTVVNQNASCFGSCDGSATVSGTGVNPIHVTWTGGVPSGLNSVTDNALCGNPAPSPQDYPVKVSDGNGCISIAHVAITEPTKIQDGAIVSPLTCNSGNTGSITLNPSGGSGSGYTFNLDNTGSTSNPVLGLSSGTHTVVITDGTGCSNTFFYNISSPTALVINVSTTNELCSGGCNGTAQASVTGGTPAYTYTWTNSLGTSISNNPNVGNLCPGNYTLSVADANNCSGQAFPTIAPANAIVPNLVKLDNSCNTGCTGSATVTPTGGSGGGFTYNWNTPGNPTVTSVSAICPGNYLVIVTDTNHCTDTTHFTINAPATVSVSVASVSPTCFGYANGSATVTPSGGTPTYTVTWSPNICIGCVSAGGLTGGSYVATVTDSKGCTGSNSFTLKDTAQLNANAVPTNPLCNNNCNGTIVSTPTGGNGGYVYHWLGIAAGNTASVSNLCPGTYTLILSDSKNCQDTVAMALTNPAPIQLNYSSVAASCGQSNGGITISNIIASGTLTVNWLAPAVCGTNTACNNLSAGIYSLTLTDANNCKDTFQIGITNSNGPLVTLNSTNVSCFGACNATASVTATGGTPGTTGYTYSWNTIPVSTATSVSGLCGSPPSYISTVTDSLLCKTLTTFSVSSPPEITDDPNIKNATCAGITNGSITSSGGGGTPSVLSGYSYQIDGLGFSANGAFTNLAVGTHTVDIKDSLGCLNSFIYTINGNNIITSQLASTNINCFGVCNGTATLSNVNGGTAPYLITWNDPSGQAGPIAGNLCSGVYTATITDNIGCQATQVATITAPSNSVSPGASVTMPSCGLCNGTISLNPSGGNGPVYTYTWSTSANTSSISNVCAALYQVDISDAAGCVNTYQIPVSNSNAPTATVSATNISCFGICDGTASVIASGGTTPYSYNWVSPSATTSSISSLCAGTYFVQVKDAANCVQTQSVTISVPIQIVLNQTVTPTDCGKCNGAISLAPTGGSGVYTYSWNGPSGALPATASQINLCAGNYTVIVNDGTCTNTSFIAVNSSNAPIVTLAVTNPACFGQSNGSATATILGGVAPVTTVWSNGSNANPDVGLNAGNYNVVVTDHNGCTSVQNFTVTAPTQIGLSLSNTQLPSCSNICNGFLTAIPSGGTLPYSYNWLPNNTTRDTIGHLCAGTYTVNVKDANGCAISQISTLVNNPFLISANPTVTNPGCGQCNGTVALAPSGGTAPYTYTWSTSSNAPGITNVCAGPYQVNITDNIGCKQTVQIPVSSSSSPTIAVSSTNVSCKGLNNGSATATASGGILPYVYNWPAIPSNNATVNNLAANIYVVEVKDSAGCIATQTVNITEPAILNANATTVAPTCGVCNGAINTTVTGGSGSYTYLWNPTGATTSNVANACAGLYTLTVGDVAGTCKDTLLITLNSSSGPTLSVSTSDNICFGQCNGSATATPTGGTSPFTYTWTSGSGTAIATGLCSQVYAVQVEDNVGCIQTATISINEPTQLIAGFPILSNPKCLNNNGGSIATVVSGGTPAYSYSWSPSSVSGANPQNLGAGVYTYFVTDANGCTVSQTASLVDNLFTINPNASITAPSCAQCNGTILLNPTGGTAPYTYTWTVASNDSIASNICAGIYQVGITDNIGCTQTIQIPVSSSNSPTVTIASTNVSCNGLSTGSATATATGGILPYVYNWPAIPSNNATVNNLAANIYFVQVKDSAGCIATQSVTITEPVALNANATNVAPTCGTCNGSINTSVTSGSGSYTYLWSPTGATTPDIANACAGIYTLILTDNGSGCKDTLLIGLNSSSGPSLSVIATDEKCFGDCNGTATVTVNGGSPGYTYTWSPVGGNAAIASNLCFNTYAVAVEDNIGCIQTQQVTINQPTKISAGLSTVSQVKCFNNTNGGITTNISGGTPAYTYSWSSSSATPATGTDPQNLGAGIYSLTVTDANQCTNTVEIDTLLNPTLLQITGTVTPASCNTTPDGSIITITTGGTPAYAYQWSGASSATTQNLPAILPGNYTVVVTDSRNCTADTNFTVVSTVSITVNAGRDTAFCTSAAFVLTGTVTGTAIFDWQTITGTIIPPVNTLSLSVNPAASTQYVLFAQNASGTCTNKDTVSLSISPAAVANAGPDHSVLGGQAIGIGGNPTNPSGGTIVWTPNTTLSDSASGNPSASPAVTTTYIVHVTNSFGCTAKDSMILTVLPPFSISSGFTPNGDGKNDTWVIDNLSMFPNLEIEVYSRWGEQLFYSKGNYTPWNGYYNGKQLPVGTYYYIIRLNDKNYPDHYAGPLTILR